VRAKEDAGTPNYYSPGLIRAANGDEDFTDDMLYANEVWCLGASFFYLCQVRREPRAARACTRARARTAGAAPRRVRPGGGGLGDHVRLRAGMERARRHLQRRSAGEPCVKWQPHPLTARVAAQLNVLLRSMMERDHARRPSAAQLLEELQDFCLAGSDVRAAARATAATR
jgi:hypothetical protein